MRFFGDEFVAGDLIGQVSGECKIGHDGLVELVSIDCEGAQFCRLDDPTGEPVELNDVDAEAIAGAVLDALQAITDAGFSEHLVIKAAA